MNDRKKAFISILIVSLIGGATSPITKIGLSEFPPFSYAFVRFLIASILLSPFFFRKNNFKNFIAQIPVSILASVNIIFFIVGVNLTTANSSQILYSAIPLLAAIFSHLFFKEKTELKKYIGIGAGFVGVFLIVLLPLIEKTKFSGNLLGNSLICVGVLSYSLYFIFSKKLQTKYTPFSLTGSFIFTTTLLLLPLSLIDLKINPSWWADLTLKGWSSIFYISIIATVIAYIFTQYAIKHGGSVFASMMFYLQPVFGFLAAFLLLGEKLTNGIILGAGLALFGVFIVTKKGKPIKEEKVIVKSYN